MNDASHDMPFKILGNRLKYLRERSQESLAEVSGAVEINEDQLAQIEQGKELPSEEILMLLMSHFNMQESEAVQVWELAGYDRKDGPESMIADDFIGVNQSKNPIVMLLAVDVRTQYTDGVDITADQSGMTLTFTQASGAPSAHAQHRQPVAKVGMSIEQAKAVSAALQKALLHVAYARKKGLPASSKQTPSDDSHPKK